MLHEAADPFSAGRVGIQPHRACTARPPSCELARNPQYVLPLWPAHGCEPVFHDRIRDGAGDCALIGCIGYEAGLVGVAHEAAFQEDGWMPDTGENTEAGPPDSSIGSSGLEKAGAVHGGSQSNIGGILSVSIAELEVILAKTASIVGHSGRRESKGFDALGTSTATGIEMDADEDRILKAVGEIDTFREGKEAVGVPGHDYLEAAGLELLFQDAADGKIVIGLLSVAIDCPRVVAAVTGIDDDGVEGIGSLDVGRAQDRIDQLAQIDTGDEIASLKRQNLEAEHELHVVHEDFLSSNGELDLDCPVFKFKERAGHLHGLEIVELPDAADSDVVAAVMPHRFPASSRGC